MAVHRLVEHAALGPDEISRMADAYACVCRRLSLTDNQYAAANEVVALKIIQLFQIGEHEPERVANRVVAELGHVLV
jgi:hypothetical protein